MTRTTFLRTAAVAAMGIITAIGFVRVFDPYGFLVPLISVVVIAHVCSALTRNLRHGGATIAMIVLGALVCIDATHWAATTWGVPTPSTFALLGDELRTVLPTLRSETAPMPVTAGLLLVTAVASWIAAWSADRLAFRYHAPVEAVVPTATIFVVVTSLADDSYRWFTVGAYAASIALHLLAARHLAGHEPLLAGKPIGDGRAPRAWRPIVGGGALALVALVVGLGAAARVPALHFSGAVPLRSDTSIQVTSPLLDMRENLGPRSNRLEFTVIATAPHYWRLTALDDFDGNTWSPRAAKSLERVDSILSTPRPRPSGGRGETVEDASFDLSGLSGRFAPTVFMPIAIDDLQRGTKGTKAELLWESSASALIASNRTGTVRGLSYRITAEPPPISTLTAGPEGAVPVEDLALPANLRRALTPLAESIVQDAGARTPVSKARAIQNFFSAENGFRYDLEVPGPADGTGDESTEAILAFLDPVHGRRGFCVQYAGTFAALARAVGLPTRLAVGFIPGEPTEQLNHDQTYAVRGRDAHTWPEVYIAGSGWMPFEPTPGRGNPDAQTWTGKPPVLSAPVAEESGSTVSATPTTSIASAAPPAPPTTPPGAKGPTPSAGGASQHRPPPAGPNRTLLVLGAVIVLVASMPLIRWVSRLRRRRAADTPARAVRLAWTDTIDAWNRLGVVRAANDTDRDIGERIARHIATDDHVDAARAVRRLATLATAAAWNPQAVSAAEVVEARVDAAGLIRVARDRRSRLSKIGGWFDPRYQGVRIERATSGVSDRAVTS